MEVTHEMWYQINLKHARDNKIMRHFQHKLIDFIDSGICKALGIKNVEGVADTIACVNWVTASRSTI